MSCILRVKTKIFSGLVQLSQFVERYGVVFVNFFGPLLCYFLRSKIDKKKKLGQTDLNKKDFKCKL